MQMFAIYMYTMYIYPNIFLSNFKTLHLNLHDRGLILYSIQIIATMYNSLSLYLYLQNHTKNGTSPLWARKCPHFTKQRP